MNIVKMQDTLKDLSDRQLMQTMQAGSTPQYLVLAEMQRRKKARDSYAKERREAGSDRSVAEDIISGIAAVPTGPMQMAEGGIVSFAKGGKTGRAKGEEEACWTDSRTGEKYCPPNTPQTEMPRKRFQEGGMIPPEEMAEMEVARRLQEMQRTNPNATRGDALQSLMREGSDIMPAMYPPNAQPSPADPMPQPETVGPVDTGGDSGPERRRGGGADGGLSFDEIFGNVADFFTAGPSVEGGTRGEIAQRSPVPEQEPTPSPDGESEPTLSGRNLAAAQAREEREAAAAEEAAAEEAAAQKTEDDNQFRPTPDETDTDDDAPELTQTPREDGLMELMRELQTEKREAREGARERALNEALIRGGLAMAASDDPDFLSAAAEGGIGGLAGYQSAMERAAERQGEISSEMVDLAVAREANDLRRQAEAAQRAGALSDLQFNRIDVLQGELENVNTQLVEGAFSEEQKKQLRKRQEQLRKALKNLYEDAGIELPKKTGGGDLGYGPDALTETP